MTAPAIKDATPRIPGTGYVSCSTFAVEKPRRADNNLFWRHIDHGLKHEQHHRKNDQGKSVYLTELHEHSCESLLNGHILKALYVTDVFLLIPIVVSDRRGHHNVTRILTLTANLIITIAMIASLIHLVTGIPQHLEAPKVLLISASALWIANILVFALWYWKLDAGGPLRRERSVGLMNSSFLFPQMLRREDEDPSWTTHFVDYLFLAFNTSTAFSPTDTAVLSRPAELGMMVQSLISLTIIALLAARAVNIL
jgi:hypothetical protein